jgi:inorganic pyrophosphatase/manganese-dependent inorganic pyrophosphatase
MSNLIITAGNLYTDIDALACAQAYTELLKLKGKNALTVLQGPLNKSVTHEVKTWGLKFETRAPKFESVSYIVVDTSDPDHVATFVDNTKIIEFFDHHMGHEDYWSKRIKGKVLIERVGACATLIWEEYKNNHLTEKITWQSANLLSTAIISNTLNFKASVTVERDLNAYKELLNYTKLPLNWIEQYFSEQEKDVYANPEKTVKEDTIIVDYPNLGRKVIIGQLELWNSKKYFNQHLDDAKNALESFSEDYWFLTSPSISEGKNYLYAENKDIQRLLETLLNVKFNDNIAEMNKLILRKEIKKMLLDYNT